MSLVSWFLLVSFDVLKKKNGEDWYTYICARFNGNYEFGKLVCYTSCLISSCTRPQTNSNIYIFAERVHLRKAGDHLLILCTLSFYHAFTLVVAVMYTLFMSRYVIPNCLSIFKICNDSDREKASCRNYKSENNQGNEFADRLENEREFFLVFVYVIPIGF